MAEKKKLSAALKEAIRLSREGFKPDDAISVEYLRGDHLDYPREARPSK